MATTLEITLNSEIDIIEQVLEGPISLQEARHIYARTELLIPGLRNPSVVRILVDATRAGSAKPEARKLLAGTLRKEELKKLAVFGANPLVSTMIRFLMYFTGMRKVAFFKSRQDALRWLCDVA